MTVITAEDIRLTPHRNLLDLIEVYVPGAMVMTHSDGMKLGMRGIISDRNVKFLLLVNGRNINQSGHSGAAAELTNWVLDDIERVEIIRGPGSVTYGPGAIAGVVNIITKTARQVQGTEVSVKYTDPYDSKSMAVNYGLRKENVEFFMHLSVAATDGVEDTRAFSLQSPLSSGYGFLGTRDFIGVNALPPPDYMRDFDHEPQYKAHFDLRLFEEWRLWARVTTSGGNVDYRNSEAPYQTGFAGGVAQFTGAQSFAMIQTRDATVQLENNHEFTDFFRLETAVGVSSQDYERRNFRPLTYGPATAPFIQDQLGDPGSVRNVVQNFSEDQFFSRLLAHFDLTEKIKFVVGGEHLMTHYGPGWFEDGNDFRMGESGAPGIPNIISDLGSPAVNPVAMVPSLNGLTPAQAIFVDSDGWTANTVSGLAELSFHDLQWGAGPSFDVITAVRVDKHRDSGNLMAPRFAVVAKLDPRNTLKFSLQESVRMGTGEQLLVSHLNHEVNTPETIKGAELAYDSQLTDHLRFGAATYYYEMQVVGWTGSPDFHTAALGDLKHCGVEGELTYADDHLRVGLNHAFVKMLDWKLGEGVAGTGVSFSDYRRVAGGRVLDGTGNDLANYANNITKFYLNYRFLKNFTFHTDARVFWGMQGSEDQFKMVQRAAVGHPDQAAINAAINRMEDDNVFGIDFRTNVSLTYDWREWLSVTLFVQNLINVTGNRRYDYDTGTSALAPRVFYVEEPRTVGLMAKVRF
ncbi:MAG: TonB-dependent receptor [Verrucomicrobia bacterium]|nr:TonB-dependent receptor [Verrucomicrobiota bacterium]